MYLYFDCFAGFDVFMALGAMLDMTKETESTQKICEVMAPGAKASLIEVTRSGMESSLAHIDTFSDEKLTRDALLELIDTYPFSPEVHDGIKSFVKIKAYARSINPETAIFDMTREMPELCAVAAVMTIAEKLKVKNTFFTRPLCSTAFQLTENGFESVTGSSTMYISKKHFISTRDSNCPSELLTEGGAALLAAMQAKEAKHTPANITKIGYGAGDEDFRDIINILRAVWGSDDDIDTLLAINAEEISNAEFSSALSFEEVMPIAKTGKF